MNPRAAKPIAIALIIVVAGHFWLIRLSNFSVGFNDDDGNGHMVQLLIAPHESPDFMLVSRMNSKETFAAPMHPEPLYDSIILVGQIVRSITPLQLTPTDFEKSIGKFKIPFAALLFAGLFVVALHLLRSDSYVDVAFRTGLLLLASSSPILMQASNEIQADTIGVLCVMPLLVVSSFQWRATVRQQVGLFCVSGLLIGMGKTEWTVCCLLGLCMISIYSLFRHIRAWQFIAGLSSGLIVGNVISYMAGPINYISGWSLLSSMAAANSVLEPAKASTWLTISKLRLPFIVPLIGIVVFAGLKLFEKRRDPIKTLILFLGIGFFLPFFLNSWGVHSRYFVPSFYLLLAAVLAFEFRSFRVDWKLTVPLVAFGLTLVWGYEFHPRTSVMSLSKVNNPPSPGCIWYTDVSEALAYPAANFVHIHMGYGYARMVATANGVSICNPIP